MSPKARRPAIDAASSAGDSAVTTGSKSSKRRGGLLANAKALAEERTAKKQQKLPPGVCQCSACGKTSEACKWALSTQTKSANGSSNLVPAGDACHDCWYAWETAFKPQYPTWEEWIEARRSSDQLTAEYDKAIDVLLGVAKADFPTEQVTSEAAMSLEIERHMVCLSEADMRAVLKTPRLLKGHTKDLRTIEAPSESEPSKMETLYVFADPSRPFRTAVVRSAQTFATEAMLQGRDLSCYLDQGRFVQQGAWTSSSSRVAAIVSGRLPSLGSFLAGHGARVPDGPQFSRRGSGIFGESAGNRTPGRGTDDSDEEIDEPAMVGIAASTVGGPKSYTTPTKRGRPPPVPSFDSGGSPPVDDASAACPEPGGGGRSSRGSAIGDDDEALFDGDESQAGSGTAKNEDDDEFEGSDDVVDIWRRRLPLAEMMVGESKGRSVKPLKDKIERLASKEESASDAQRLKLYLGNVLFAQSMRRDRLLKLPDAELQAAVTSLVREKVVFPEETQFSIVEHKVKSLIKRFQVRDLALCCKPWCSPDVEFDCTKPLLGPVRVSTTTKISKSRSWLWSRCVAPLLMGGQDSASRIVEVAQAVLDSYDSEDVLELDGACASYMGECVEAARGIICIADRLADPELLLPALKVIDRKGRTDKGVLTIVANAIMTSPWMMDRANKLTTAQVVITSHGGRFAEHSKELDKAKPGCDVAHWSRMDVVCKDVTKVRASGHGDLFEGCANKLLDLLKSSWTVTSDGFANGTVNKTPELLKILEQVMAEASLAFSLEADVANIKNEVASAIASQSGEEKQQALISQVEAQKKIDLGAAGISTTLENFTAVLTACRGFSLLPETKAAIDKLCIAVAEGCADSLHEGDLEYLPKALDLWDDILTLHVCSAAKPSAAKLARGILGAMAAADKAFAEKREDMQSMRAEVLGVSVSMQKLRDLRACVGEEKSELMKTLMTVADTCLSSTATRIVEFTKKDMERRLTDLKTTKTIVEGIVGGMNDVQRWHREVEDDWDAFCAAAAAHLGRIDTRLLETTLVSLKSQIGDCSDTASVLKDQDEKFDSGFEADGYDDFYKRSKAVLHEAMLQYALQRETDRDSLRKKVQQHIKGLRSLGITDKTWLHKAQGKRAWDLLHCSY